MIGRFKTQAVQYNLPPDLDLFWAIDSPFPSPDVPGYSGSCAGTSALNKKYCSCPHASYRSGCLVLGERPRLDETATAETERCFCDSLKMGDEALKKGGREAMLTSPLFNCTSQTMCASNLLSFELLGFELLAGALGA